MIHVHKFSIIHVGSIAKILNALAEPLDIHEHPPFSRAFSITVSAAVPHSAQGNNQLKHLSESLQIKRHAALRDGRQLVLCLNNGTRMKHIEHGSNKEHQRRIEDVNVHLACHQRSIATSDVLGNPENRPNHDQKTCAIKDPEERSPAQGGRVAGISGVLIDAIVEQKGDDDEASEKENLDGEAGDDDVFAEVNVG